jgi:isopenicillin N synthase-like dioxygenase
MASLPVVDLSGGVGAVASAMDAACREHGFFTVVGHGIDPSLLVRLDAAARSFFALPASSKAAVSMSRGGRAWRGWFPVGGELTAGVPDHKEGLYLGAELPPGDPRVLEGRPLHGPNLWPASPPELRPAVEEWMAAMTELGHTLMRGLALGLGLPGEWFADHLTSDPVVLFRIFHYPPVPAPAEGWGVAEHTDYGLLTILAQDHHGGLQVRSPDGGWIDVPAEPGVLVCNIGDMLDRLTAGRYRSTPHRVLPTSSSEGRLSFPFFFDPGWDAEVEPLPLDGAPPPESVGRWDNTNLQTLSGTYGDYLTKKVTKVFPELADDVI